MRGVIRLTSEMRQKMTREDKREIFGIAMMIGVFLSLYPVALLVTGVGVLLSELALSLGLLGIGMWGCKHYDD